MRDRVRLGSRDADADSVGGFKSRWTVIYFSRFDWRVDDNLIALSTTPSHTATIAESVWFTCFTWSSFCASLLGGGVSCGLLFRLLFEIGRADGQICLTNKHQSLALSAVVAVRTSVYRPGLIDDRCLNGVPKDNFITQHDTMYHYKVVSIWSGRFMFHLPYVSFKLVKLAHYCWKFNECFRCKLFEY